MQSRQHCLLPLIRGDPFNKLESCSLAGGQNIATKCKESELNQMLNLQWLNMDKIGRWDVAESVKLPCLQCAKFANMVGLQFWNTFLSSVAVYQKRNTTEETCLKSMHAQSPMLSLTRQGVTPYLHRGTLIHLNPY